MKSQEDKKIKREPVTRWVFTEVVDYVSEKFQHIYISGYGKDAKFEDRSLGWFVCIQGHGESFYISGTEPDLHAGDKVKITIERVDAEPR